MYPTHYVWRRHVAIVMLMVIPSCTAKNIVMVFVQTEKEMQQTELLLGYNAICLWTCVLWVIKDRFKGSLIRPFALGSSKNPTVPDLIDYLLGPGGSELFDENLIQRGNTPQMCFSHGYGFTSAFLLTWNTTTPTWINDHPITPRDPLNISTD